VAEGLELGDQSSGLSLGIGAVVVEVGAEVVIGSFGREDVPDDDQQGVGDGDDGFFFAAGLR
jgi:hypothetical protein